MGSDDKEPETERKREQQRPSSLWERLQLPKSYRGVSSDKLHLLQKQLDSLDISDCNPEFIHDPKYRLLHRVGLTDKQIHDLFEKEDFRTAYKWLYKTIVSEGGEGWKKSRDFRIRQLSGDMQALAEYNLSKRLREKELEILLDYPTVLGAEALGHNLQRMIGRNALRTFLDLREAAMHTYDAKLKIASHILPYIPDPPAIRRILSSLYEEHGKDAFGRMLGEHTLAKKISAITKASSEEPLWPLEIRGLIKGTGSVNAQKALILANALLALADTTPLDKFQTIQQLEEAGRALPPAQKKR